MNKGDVIGDFEITEALRQDSFYETYRAVSRGDRKTVILKVLGEGLANNEAAVSGFDSMSDKMMHIKGCKGVIGVSQRSLGGSFKPTYIIRQFVDDKSLEEITAQADRLDAQQIIALGTSVLKVLENAKHYGLIHGNLAASNIFVREGKRPRVTITDFGMSPLALSREAPLSDFPVKHLNHLSSRTLSVPRPEPEHADDLYSLAYLLYALHFGTPPFDADSTKGLVAQKQKISRPVADPDKFSTMLSSAMSKDQLEAFLSQVFVESGEGPDVTEDGKPPADRRGPQRTGIQPQPLNLAIGVGLAYGEPVGRIDFEDPGDTNRNDKRTKRIFVWNQSKYGNVTVEPPKSDAGWLSVKVLGSLKELGFEEKGEIEIVCDPVIDKSLKHKTTPEATVIFESPNPGVDPVKITIRAVFKPESAAPEVIDKDREREKDKETEARGAPKTKVIGIIAAIAAAVVIFALVVFPRLSRRPSEGPGPEAIFREISSASERLFNAKNWPELSRLDQPLDSFEGVVPGDQLASVLFWRGRAEYELNRYDEAKELFRKAVEHDRNNAIYYAKLAWTHHLLGERVEACRVCEAGLRIDPDNREMKELWSIACEE